MKQQGSLITALLVILESIAVVGFLFLIFAVSSSNNIGKYEYRLHIKSVQNELGSLAEAVIWAIDQGEQLSFHTDENGIVHFRTLHPLESVTVSAKNHFTQSFLLKNASAEEANEHTFSLKTIEKETSDTLTQTIKTISVMDEQNQPITNALVTLISETPAPSFQYDLTQENYSLVITDQTQEVRFSVSAPGYVSEFNLPYNAYSPIVTLKKQPNLNFPYEFKVSVYDAEEHAQFSNLGSFDVVNDALQEISKKALDTVSLFVDQGAVIKYALGSFQVFSRKAQNEVQVHAPHYVAQQLSLVHEENENNHYEVFLKKDEETFVHKVRIQTYDNHQNPMTVNLQTEAKVAIQKEDTGIYQILTNAPALQLDIAAEGYITQQVPLAPEEQTTYKIAMQPIVQRTYAIQVTDRKNHPLVGAVVTILGEQPETSRTNEEGKVVLSASQSAKKALLAAPEYITQTVPLPLLQEEDPVQASYQLKKNPMSAISYTVRVNVLDEHGQFLKSNISSNVGFVSQEKEGHYKILSPSQDLQINISAQGYHPQIVDLSKEKFQDSVSVSLQPIQVEERVNLMSSAKHQIAVKILNEKGSLMAANVSSTEGFVSRKSDGIYEIFTPTQDLQLDVSATGYHPETVQLSERNPQEIVSVSLKPIAVAEHVNLMSSAKHQITVQVLDEKKHLMSANVSSTAGFVSRKSDGKYEVFTPTQDLQLEVTAAGYHPEVVRLSEVAPQKAVSVQLKPIAVAEHVKLMSSAKHKIVVKVKDEQGRLMSANVGSTAGFVQRKSEGVYEIFTPTPDLQIEASAPGYEKKTMQLSKTKPRKSVSLSLQPVKMEEHVQLMTSAKRTIQVKVLDEQGNPLVANVSSSTGFVTQGRNGIYKIFSPTYDMDLKISAAGYEHQTMTLSEKNPKDSLQIKLKKMEERVHQMVTAIHTIKVKVLDQNGKPMNANVSSSAGFVTQGRNGIYKIFSPTYDMDLKISAPGHEHQTISLLKQKNQKEVTVALKKTQEGVVLNTEVGDRLILSKGVVYRVLQPIDQKTVKVFRRTDPIKGEFNDYPEGKIMSLSQFNQEIELEKNQKNFFDENVWVTVYALDRKEYFLFKDVYRKQWADYKLVYANHR